MPKEFHIIKKTDDPVALRASIGGTELMGYYCVYRGSKTAITSMLEQVLENLRQLKAEPQIEVELKLQPKPPSKAARSTTSGPSSAASGAAP